jgi:hypothetical protein
MSTLPALLALIGITGVPLSAGTVITQASSSLPFDPSGAGFPPTDSTFCAQSDIGPVSCMITADFAFRIRSSHADISGAADFGSISGSLFTAVVRGDVAGLDQSSFGDFVTVLGGTGQGTLITHYQLVSTGEQDRQPGVPLAPFYRFVQGNVAVEHTPALPVSQPQSVSTLLEDLDVTSTITFGVPLPLAAGTRVEQSLGLLNDFGSAGTTSSAQITGFTVLDSGGNVVADSMIQRSFSTAQPDPFAPEPGTFAMILSAGVIILSFDKWILRRCKRSNCRPSIA